MWTRSRQIAVWRTAITAASNVRFVWITVAITQVAANTLKIKIDAKCDLGSSHCYAAFAFSVSVADGICCPRFAETIGDTLVIVV